MPRAGDTKMGKTVGKSLFLGALNLPEDRPVAIMIQCDKEGGELSMRKGPLRSDQGDQEGLDGGGITKLLKHLVPTSIREYGHIPCLLKQQTWNLRMCYSSGSA